MNNFWRKFKIAVLEPSIRNKILFVLFILIVFRFLAAIPIPGVDTLQLQSFLSENQFLGLLNVFSGGGLSSLSLIMLGVGPYITSSIIMQLLTTVTPKLKALFHEEGEIGRKKFNQYSRFLTVFIAIVQGYSLLTLLSNQGVLGDVPFMAMVFNTLIITAGAMLIMWLGEITSEFGIGNGVSVIIFAGIVASIPAGIAQLAFAFDISQIPLYIGGLILILIIIAGVILVNEGERPVAVTYAKQVRGGRTYSNTQTYIPLKINQAGVMPIIFALSILLFPTMIANLFVGSDIAWVASAAQGLLNLTSNGWVYSITYFVLVFLFTFFYTAITFDPNTMANNLQKNGAFIPGIRPGENTMEYISGIVTRITFFGAIFLSVIAVLPIIIQSVTGIAAFAIGGTSLLIVVSVTIDIIKKLDAQVAMMEY